MKKAFLAAIIILLAAPGPQAGRAAPAAPAGSVPCLVLLAPMPLPLDPGIGKGPHERIFTGELYSDEPQGEKPTGWFVPKDATRMWENAIRNVAAERGLPFSLASCPDEIPSERCVVLLVSIRRFACGNAAEAEADVQALAGPEYRELWHKTFKRSLDAEKAPFIAGRPIHMVGSHELDFHPQRSMLSKAATGCAEEMLDALDLRKKP